jgi:hypothetical protein
MVDQPMLRCNATEWVSEVLSVNKHYRNINLKCKETRGQGFI